MLGRIISASLLAGCLCSVFAQAPPTDSINSNPGRSTLYILFLTQHALDADRRKAGTPVSNPESLAQHLRVRSEDLQVLDSNALAYASQDKGIHQDAMNYFTNAKPPINRSTQ